MTIIYILAFVVIYIKEINPLFKIKLFKRKPLNCELCIAFWVTIAHNQIYGIYTTGDAALVALAAPLTLNLYNKLWLWTLK